MDEMGLLLIVLVGLDLALTFAMGLVVLRTATKTETIVEADLLGISDALEEHQKDLMMVLESLSITQITLLRKLGVIVVASEDEFNDSIPKGEN